MHTLRGDSAHTRVSLHLRSSEPFKDTAAMSCILGGQYLLGKKCRNCGHTNRTVFNSLFCIHPYYHQLYHLKLVHHLD